MGWQWMGKCGTKVNLVNVYFTAGHSHFFKRPLLLVVPLGGHSRGERSGINGALFNGASSQFSAKGLQWTSHTEWLNTITPIFSNDTVSSWSCGCLCPTETSLTMDLITESSKRQSLSFTVHIRGTTHDTVRHNIVIRCLTAQFHCLWPTGWSVGVSGMRFNLLSLTETGIELWTLMFSLSLPIHSPPTHTLPR